MGASCSVYRHSELLVAVFYIFFFIFGGVIDGR